jgi:hypothetical protein
MEISADFAFSNLQQFGEHFVENHLEAFKMPLSILQRVSDLTAAFKCLFFIIIDCRSRSSTAQDLWMEF